MKAEPAGVKKAAPAGDCQLQNGWERAMLMVVSFENSIASKRKF